LNFEPETSNIKFVGTSGQGGTYLLRIAVSRPLPVAFGRFRGGEPVAVPRGTLVYVGSALAEKGAASLARRLLRHATRSGGKPPHHLRAEMLAAFSAAGLAAKNLFPKNEKKLRWHIDFLLEETAAEIDRVLVIRSPKRLESVVAAIVAADPRSMPLAAGLGASDTPGETHLFRVPDDEGWWEMLAARSFHLA